MDGEAMEALRHIMRSQASFAGMEVLTYCFLANHFHIFVRLDPKETENLDDAGLVRRFRALYGGTRCASLGLDADDLEVILAKNRSSTEGIRRRLKARMGNASVFMREVKTRFTLWNNRKHGTVGTAGRLSRKSRQPANGPETRSIRGTLGTTVEKWIREVSPRGRRSLSRGWSRARGEIAGNRG
ncbi:MAG: hypothetical protein JJT96_12115 [Opitutales bacterium]|nr:hypothetical protein [Opitutales bacterium]